MSESQSAIIHLLNWARLPSVLGSRLLWSRRSRLFINCYGVKGHEVCCCLRADCIMGCCHSGFIAPSGSLNKSSRTAQSHLRVPRTARDLSRWRASLKLIGKLWSLTSHASGGSGLLFNPIITCKSIYDENWPGTHVWAGACNRLDIPAWWGCKPLRTIELIIGSWFILTLLAFMEDTKPWKLVGMPMWI
jgi:hypothetical protein